MRTGAWTSVLFMIPRVVIVLALAATVTSTLRVYPHQLAYFNAPATGPRSDGPIGRDPHCVQPLLLAFLSPAFRLRPFLLMMPSGGAW